MPLFTLKSAFKIDIALFRSLLNLPMALVLGSIFVNSYKKGSLLDALDMLLSPLLMIMILSLLVSKYCLSRTTYNFFNDRLEIVYGRCQNKTKTFSFNSFYHVFFDQVLVNKSDIGSLCLSSNKKPQIPSVLLVSPFRRFFKKNVMLFDIPNASEVYKDIQKLLNDYHAKNPIPSEIIRA